MDRTRAQMLAELDHRHVWHPFTAMRQWREQPPLIIERAEGEYLIDTEGRRYIDGVSSLWCNVHGHRVPAIDRAIREQLDKVAHTTLLGLASPPSIELAAELVSRSPREGGGRAPLNKVFYSDAGATALEVALKMAVGYWHHRGRPRKSRFIALAGAYHGDTTGSMSVGYSELFHRPFVPMVFPVRFAPAPDACRLPAEISPEGFGCFRGGGVWPSEDAGLAAALTEYCLGRLDELLGRYADETAGVVIEPVMQGAAGMVCQPAGFVRRVAELARRHEVLLIADEVATGFGRTGRMFACEHDGVTPDILCVAKGITGGYLPLAATLATDEVEQAFCGEWAQRRTLFHGHTYTGNALACAAALASLRLFDEGRLLEHVRGSAALMAEGLDRLRGCGHVLDVRQRGVMVGIELCGDRRARQPLDFTKRTGAAMCLAMRGKGLILRPLGDVLVLMPIPAMAHESLRRMVEIVVESILGWDWACT
jgi:adenosylmethionine-8-amino-7-oxononanoate aminotransferase